MFTQQASVVYLQRFLDLDLDPDDFAFEYQYKTTKRQVAMHFCAFGAHAFLVKKKQKFKHLNFFHLERRL